MQLGADVTALDNLAAEMERAAATLDRVIAELSAQAGRTWWRGPVAARFQTAWSAQHQAALRGATAFLRTPATQVRGEAKEQTAKSGAAGPGALGAAGPGALGMAGAGVLQLQKFARSSASGGRNSSLAGGANASFNAVPPSPPSPPLFRTQADDFVHRLGPQPPYAAVGPMDPLWKSYADKCILGAPHYNFYGTMIGPDGRAYQVVVPKSKGLFNADFGSTGSKNMSNLDGLDPGWKAVGTEAGVGQFGNASGAARTAVALGTLAGGQFSHPFGNPVDLDGYANLVIRPDGSPELREWGASSGLIDSDVGRQMPRQVETVGNGIELANQVAAIPGNVKKLDDAYNMAYQVQYAENRDGRLRAIITTYQLREKDNGHVNVAMNYAGVVGGKPLLVEGVTPRLNPGYEAPPNVSILPSRSVKR